MEPGDAAAPATTQPGNHTSPAACPACGGPLEPWLRAPAAELDAPSVGLARCRACGTAVTLDPAPADAHDTGDYAPGAPRGARLAAPLLAAFDRQRLHLLARAPREGRTGASVPASAPSRGSGGLRLLDVGAGRGRFVAAARAAGYEARGIEPSARGVAGARDTYGVTLERAGIADAHVEPGTVDVLTLWHVLEHVDAPGDVLATLRGWLAPGGVLLVGVPNLASWQARLAGPRWYHLDLPRHRTHFTATGLRTLLRANGFAVTREVHVLAEHNPLGMWLAWTNRGTAQPNYLYHLLKRNAPLRPRDLAVTALALPLIPLAVLAELLAGLVRRGGTVAIVATAA